VIARNSSFIYKGKSVHMKQIAEELGVSYVVEGSVRKSDDHVRITAQLNDVTTGSHIWAEKYDRGLADVFAVQDEITEAIVAAIEPQLYAAENFHARRKPNLRAARSAFSACPLNEGRRGREVPELQFAGALGRKGRTSRPPQQGAFWYLVSPQPLAALPTDHHVARKSELRARAP